MFGSLGAPELLIILGIVVLIFGVGRISGLGRELGGSIKEFRKAVKDEDAEQGVDDKLEASTRPEEPQASPRESQPSPTSQGSSGSKPPNVF